MFSASTCPTHSLSSAPISGTRTRLSAMALVACVLFATVAHAESVADMLRPVSVNPPAGNATQTLSADQRNQINSVVRNSTNQIWFEKNVGQFPTDARYGFKTAFGKTLVYDNHIQLISNQVDPMKQNDGFQTVNISFTGSNPTWSITPGGASSVSGHYQQPNGTALTPEIFNEVTLHNVYDGIDLRLYSAARGTLEFDWIVARAQDYEKIRIAANGQDGIEFNADGSATLQLRYQDIAFHIPESYQVINGTKHLVTATMTVGESTNEIRYAIAGDIVADQPLVIDPNVVWATYMDLNDSAATFDSYLYAIAINSAGVYCMGWLKENVSNATYGAGKYLEVDAGFAQGSGTGQNYIYRLSPDGMNITAWTSTGIGALVTGNQTNTIPPTVMELFPDGRVLAAMSDGTLQIYSANLSSQSFTGIPNTMNTINSLAIVDNNSFYVGGLVAAADNTLVPPASTLDTTFAGATEGIIIRYTLNGGGTPVADWATYIGGNFSENFCALALTPDNSKLCFAVHSNVGAAYPSTVNPITATATGTTTVIIGVLPEQATKPAAFNVFSFLGGSTDNGTTGTNKAGTCLVIAKNTGFWVAGNTNSTDFPGITGGSQSTYGGGQDCFVSYIPINGSAGAGFQSTFVGGSDLELIGGLAYDPGQDRVLVFGTTGANFPTLNTTPTSNYFNSVAAGGLEIFVATFNGALTTKDYSTFISGTGNDYLGDTGLLRGTGHVKYSSITSQFYLGTTIHSDITSTLIGKYPGKDITKTNSTNDAHCIFAFTFNRYDFGDAPASYEAGDPAAEAISTLIRIGATVDAELSAQNGPLANGDDTNGTPNDEDGVASLATLNANATTYSVTVSVLNNTGAARNLQGWIDFNRNGVFDASERATVSVPASAAQQSVTLTWSGLSGLVAGTSYLRLRISDDNTVVLPTGTDATGHGEIEDYLLPIVSADLSITKNDSTTTYTAGTNTTYTITVNNAGPSDAASLVFSDVMPANTTFVSLAVPAGWTRTDSTAVGANGTITATRPALVSGAAAQVFTLVLATTSGRTGSLANTATISSATFDLDNTNNSATDTDTAAPSADVSITKTDSSTTFVPGTTVSYTITVNNTSGPSDAQGLTFSDILPTGTTLNSITVPAGWTRTDSTAIGANGTITATRPTLVAGAASQVFTIVLNVASSLTTNLDNTATISTTTSDPTPGNNSATDSDTPAPSADLAITKTDGSATYTPGSTVSYTITVTNTSGPSDAQGLTFSDVLPAGTTLNSITIPSGWARTDSTAVGANGTLTATRTTLAAGAASQVFTVVINVPSSRTTSLPNTATISSTTSDPTPGNNSATDTDTAAPSADLQITKTDGAANAIPGSAITYTIVVTNAGPSDVTGATVADTIPAVLLTPTYTSVLAGGATGATASGSGNINDTVNIPVGSTITYTLNATISGSATVSVSNTATVTVPSGTTDPTPGNNSATDTDTLTPTADLQITKIDGVASATPGGSVTYTIVVTNAGPSPVTGATITDTFPAAITSVNYTTVSAGGATGAPASGSGNISHTVNMPVGSTITYTATAAISSGATVSLSNTATVAVPSGTIDPTPGNNSATDTDTLVPSADLSSSKTDGSATYVPGTVVTYTITVNNTSGPSDAQGLTMTDILPAGTTLNAITIPSGWTRTDSTAIGANGTITVTRPTLVAGAAPQIFTIAINTSAALTTNLVNTGTVTSTTPDPTPGNNPGTDTDTPSPSSDLSVTITDGSATYTAGTDVTYTIVVNNAGPSDAQNALLSNPLPAGATFVSLALPAGWSRTDSTAVGANGTITATRPTLAAGAPAQTFTLVVRIPSNATGNLVDTVTVSSASSDPTPANNTATDTDTPLPSADLSSSKTDGSATYVPGTVVTYTITVNNTSGPSDAQGLTMTDILPAGTTLNSITIPSGWTRTDSTAIGANGTITVTRPTLVAGAAPQVFTIAINTSAALTTNLVNTGTVTSTTPDPTPGNNPGTDTDTPSPSSDLSVTITDGSATYTAGTDVTYTIVVNNAGPSDAQNALLSNPLPAGATFVSLALPAGWSRTDITAVGANGTITATRPTLAAGAPAQTFTLVVRIPSNATGNLVDTVTVSSASSDPTPANNTATDTDTPAPSADLSSSKTDGSATYVPGTVVTYTITVNNTSGPSDAQGLTMTDILPAGTTLNSITIPSGWTRTDSTAIGANGTITVTRPTLVAGAAPQVFTIAINTSAALTTNLVNTGTVTSTTPDPTPGNNPGTDTDTPSPSSDVSVTITDGSATYTAGTDVTYTITVNNAGPSDAQNLLLSNPLPAGTTFVSLVVPSGWTRTDSTAVGANGTITATRPTLAPSTPQVFTLVVRVPSSATGNLTDIVNVSTTTSDPTPANNTASDTDTPAPSADLAITKTDGVLSATAGTSVTYTIVATNNGPSDVTGATIIDSFPAVLTGISYTAVATGGATGFTASGSGNINNTVSMPAGSTITYTATATINASATGSVSNTATVSVPVGTTDPIPGNNSATDTDGLSGIADLSITKTDGVATAIPGTTTTYTIVVSNAGPSAVVNATVTDTFPASITNVSYTTVFAGGSSGAPASGTGNINHTVTLPVGSSITYTAVATISPAAVGTLSNTATVTAPPGTTDPTPGNNSASDTDTLTPQADLQITKTDGSATAIPGTAITYTIVVTNAGPSNVTAATVVDNVPAAITGVTYTAVQTGGSTGFTASGSGNINDTVNIPTGGTITYTLTGTVSSTATGTLTNTATVTPPVGTFDPTPGNNTATDGDTLPPRADLSITKTDGSATAVPGTAITYTIVVTNAGPSIATGATVLDTLPAAITGVTYTAVTAGGASGFTASGSGNISDTVTMPVGSTITYTVSGTISAAATGTLTNTATVTPPVGTTDPNPGNNTGTDTDTLTPQTDLQITKTNGAATSIPGTNTTYTIVVTNAGPSVAVGAVIADVFPATLSSITYTAVATGGASGFTASGSGNINNTVTMPVGSTITYTATALISAAATGSLSNTATVTPPVGTTDPTPGNNTATDTDTLIPTADLSITKTDGAVTAIPGTGIVYTVVVTNSGPSNVTAATVVDTMPAALTGVTYTAVTSGGSTGFTASGSGNINDSVNMPVGSTITYTITATISPAATGTLTNTATVTPPPTTTDPNPGNNTGTDGDTLTPQADLQITKTDGSATAIPGTNVTYTIVVTNAGPSVATGASVVDTFPAALSNVSYTAIATGGASGFQASGVGNINHTVNMPVGSTITYTATALIASTATGSLSNTATVTPPVGTTDLTPGNNTATDTDTLIPTADLSLTKTNGVVSVVPGTAITYTIVVTNAGPSIATNATVVDTMPVALTGVTYTAVTSGGASGFTASGSGNISDTVTMPVGSTITYTVSATINPAATGTLTNTAVVTPPPTTTDPNPGNNTGTDGDPLTPQADLQITKTNGTATAIPGTNTTYTIVVTNAGPSVAVGAVIADAFPASLSNINYTAVATGGASGFTASGSGNINNTVTMPVGSTITYTATALISAAATGSLSNTATVTPPVGTTDPTPGNNTATDTDTLIPTADLSVTKTDGSATAIPGNGIVYTIVVTNSGPSNVVGATVVDTMPAVLTNVTYTAVTSGGASGFTASGNGNINDTVNMPVGSTITYTVTALIQPSATGTLTNTATVTPPVGTNDPTPGNNTGTDIDTLTPRADLSITKTDGVATAIPGTNTTYTISVFNAGPSDVIGAVIADIFPATLSNISYTTVGINGSSGYPASGVGNINHIVNMPSGSTIIYTATALISPSATGTLSNTATVTAPVGTTDPTPGNNSATDTDTLIPTSDIQVVKTVDIAAPQLLANITYTVTVTNNGPSATTGVVITDAIPAGLTFVSSIPSQGSYVSNPGTWTIGAMALNASVTLTIVDKVQVGTSGQNIVNTATVTGNNNIDPVPANNTSSVTVVPLPCPFPVITSLPMATPNPSLQGLPVTFTDVAADPENRPLTYSWNFGDGTTGTGSTVVHAFALPGVFTVTLTVTNDCGNQVVATLVQTVQPADCDSLAPAIKNPPQLSVTYRGIDLKYDFVCTASDIEDGTITNIVWQFGDGAFGTGVSVSHTYAASGLYFVTALVTDSDGNCRKQVVVANPFPGTTSTSNGVDGGTPDALPLNCTLLIVKGIFNKTPQDSLTLVVQLNGLPGRTAIAGKPFSIQVAGLQVTGTFDGNGAFKTSTRAVQTKNIGSNTILTLKISKEEFKKKFAMFVNANISNQSISGIGVQVTVNGKRYASNLSGIYNSKINVLGVLQK